MNSTQQQAVENFSHYKLNAIKYEYMPLSNVIGQTAQNATTLTVHAFGPQLLSLFVNNRDEAYDSFGIISNNVRHKSHGPLRYISRFARLKPQVDVAMGVTNVTYTAPNRYISTGDLDAVYGRFVVCPQDADGIDAAQQSSQVYRLKTTHYVQLKNMNIN